MVLRSDFDDEVRSLFVYRGVRLVRSTFPNYGPELERLLLEYVATGRENDMEFAIGILRAYDGSPAIRRDIRDVAKGQRPDGVRPEAVIGPQAEQPMPALSQGMRLHPDYDEPYLTGLLKRLDTEGDDIVHRLVRRSGRPIGWSG